MMSSPDVKENGDGQKHCVGTGLALPVVTYVSQVSRLAEPRREMSLSSNKLDVAFSLDSSAVLGRRVEQSQFA